MHRPFKLTLAAALAASALVAKAADELPDDQMGPHQFSGVINADNVYLRSYASENDYAVATLSKGESVTVVGNRGEWLKVLPPKGSFCLVGKAWVDARQDGTVGRLSDDAPVRMGSLVGPQYGKIATQVKAGQDVRILGQVDAYYKIAPPPGAFNYVHRRFVDPIKPVEVITDGGVQIVKPVGESASKTSEKTTPTKPPASAGVSPTGSDGNPQLVKIPTSPNGTEKPPADTAVSTPTTAPTNAVAFVPATQPAATGDAVAAFTDLEARFMAASKKPLLQQPITELAGEYQGIVDAKAVPESMLKIAEYRLTGLKIRQGAAETLRQTEAAQKDRASKHTALVAEGREISDRMTANEVRRYTAVGTLRTSALPYAGGQLYRLTDPATGRTVVYVVNDGKAAALDGQFVGVRGTVADDASRQIKLLTPQSLEPINPADVSSGTISSIMTPASLTATSDASR